MPIESNAVTMSSPSSTPRRSSRRSRTSSATGAGQDEPSSDLAQPLPQSSPMQQEQSPAVDARRRSGGDMPPPEPPRSVSGSGVGGPGSVMVSEIDLSSPLNYGTPSSADSGHRTPRSASVRGTPIRIRSDIQSERRLRQVDVTPARIGSGAEGPSSDAGSARTPTSAARRSGRSSRGTPSQSQPPQPPSDVVPPSENSESAPHLVIWGTDVSVQTCKQKFRRFLTTFVDPNVEEDEMTKEGFRSDEPLYMQRIEEVITLFFVLSPFIVPY